MKRSKSLSDLINVTKEAILLLDKTTNGISWGSVRDKIPSLKRLTIEQSNYVLTHMLSKNEDIVVCESAANNGGYDNYVLRHKKHTVMINNDLSDVGHQNLITNTGDTTLIN